MTNCQMCKKPLDQGDARSVDCGGDCAECMAKSGDTDCAKLIALEDFLKPFSPTDQLTAKVAFEAGWNASREYS